MICCDLIAVKVIIMICNCNVSILRAKLCYYIFLSIFHECVPPFEHGRSGGLPLRSSRVVAQLHFVHLYFIIGTPIS